MSEVKFTDYSNPDRERMRAVRLMDWGGWHEVLSDFYSLRSRSGKPIWLGVGILRPRYSCWDDRAREDERDRDGSTEAPQTNLYKIFLQFSKNILRY